MSISRNWLNRFACRYVAIALIGCVGFPYALAAERSERNSSGDDVAFYAGGAGNQRFYAVTQLSDGSVLIAGTADNLDWLPATAKKIELDVAGLQSKPSGKIPLMLHLTADLKTVSHVVSLTKDAAADIRFIKSTNLPGEKTGTLYISGQRLANDAEKIKPGYYIAKLDGNFVDRSPTRLDWVQNIWATDRMAEDQPWDVGSDGKVVFAEGTPHGYDWLAVKRLTADGKPDVVEDWRLHLYEQEGKRREWFGTPATKCPHGKVTDSMILLKVWSRGDFRSWTQADYELVTPDGNGGTKQGRWPYDVFFEGPFNAEAPDSSPRGRGYTGYGWSSTPCGNVGAIAIDRRDNHFYIGGNNKSRLPTEPDFEPHVVAMTDAGKLKWWMRLYREVPPGPGEQKTDNQDARLSTPDQYIDGMTIDYTRSAADEGALVVLARAHGNNRINLWNGNEIKHPSNPGTSFQPHFTGNNGNIHYQWLGRMTLRDGTMLHATYVAETTDNARVGKKSWPDENLDGWPMYTSGWPDLNTTRCRPTIQTDAAGNIYVLGTGRRPVTTRNAFMKMPKPGEAESRWCDFVRVYSQDLTTLRYSTILTGQWDWKTKAGGSGVSLQGVIPTRGGLYTVGYTTRNEKNGDLGTTDMPIVNPPDWSASKRTGEMGVAGLLKVKN